MITELIQENNIDLLWVIETRVKVTDKVKTRELNI